MPGARVPRRSSFSLRLALRSVLLSAMAIAVASIVSGALPKLTAESKGLDATPVPAGQYLVAIQDVLPFVPVPGLVFGLAALLFRPLRPIFAVLATVASVAALVLIAGSLLTALAPMYQMPKDLAGP